MRRIELEHNQETWLDILDKLNFQFLTTYFLCCFSLIPFQFISSLERAMMLTKNLSFSDEWSPALSLVHAYNYSICVLNIAL